MMGIRDRRFWFNAAKRYSARLDPQTQSIGVAPVRRMARGRLGGTHLKIYCDTSTLPENIRGTDAKSQKELSAREELQELGVMLGSHIVRYEVMNTKDESKRNQLLAEQAALKPIPPAEQDL
jgi:hypothetical protein